MLGRRIVFFVPLGLFVHLFFVVLLFCSFLFYFLLPDVVSCFPFSLLGVFLFFIFPFPLHPFFLFFFLRAPSS